MKALVKKYDKVGLWLDEVPVPEIGINDVLIKIKKTSICGTDVHIYNWDEWAQRTIKTPMVIGHEYVGTIEAVGSNVHDYYKGELVSGEGHLVCGHCRNCLAGRRHLCMNTRGVGVNRDGAFAEYLAIPASNVWVCDPNIPEEVLSIFDPFGNAVHTALSFELLGEDVLITGAGPIGIMAAAVAKHAGARYVVITDINQDRLSLAKQMGVTRAVNVSSEKLVDDHLKVFDCAFKPRNGKRFIHYLAHLKMMAAVQPFISGAISKTINMPKESTAEEIAAAYMEGWKLGLKAVAIYRDGSKKLQPVSTKKHKDTKGKAASAEIPAPTRPFRRQ